MKRESFQTIGIIGTGLMGHGLAIDFARAGRTVHLCGRSVAKTQAALETIRERVGMLQSNGWEFPGGAEAILANIRTFTVLGDAVTDVDLVVEAVAEDLAVKQVIFGQMEEACPEHAILASTTSTIMPGAIAAKLRRPERVIVAHYFNPPYLLPLVEIVAGPRTLPAVTEAMMAMYTAMGKQPVRVLKEAPGFVGNRLQAALLREAMSIVEQGIATPADVDAVIRTSFGRRLAGAGIFETFELAGWDLWRTIMINLLPEIESSTAVPGPLEERVKRNELGVKTGQGFYAWDDDSAAEIRGRLTATLTQLASLHDCREVTSAATGRPLPSR